MLRITLFFPLVTPVDNLYLEHSLSQSLWHLQPLHSSTHKLKRWGFMVPVAHFWKNGPHRWTPCAFSQHWWLTSLHAKWNWLTFGHCFSDLRVNRVSLQQRSASRPSRFIRNQQRRPITCCCQCCWQLHRWDMFARSVDLSRVCILAAVSHSSVTSSLVTKGVKVNQTSEIHLMKNTFQLAFYDFPPALKPSLHFSSKVSELLLLFCWFDMNFKQLFP